MKSQRIMRETLIHRPASTLGNRRGNTWRFPCPPPSGGPTLGAGTPIGVSVSTEESVAFVVDLSGSTGSRLFVPELEAVEVVEANPAILLGLVGNARGECLRLTGIR